MDLIYTNKNKEDVGILLDYDFDLAFGSGENDFELKVALDNHCCSDGCLVYIEGTEYGGIIDKVKIATKSSEITYKGRTWHGILASKVIEPDANEAYLTVSGEANAVIEMLLERVGLSDLFTVSSDVSELTIKNYKMNRYVDAYTGIKKMLASADGKLQITFQNGKVVLSALPLVDYSTDEEYDNDQVEMEIEKAYAPINHLICLGGGQLADRLVLHLYTDEHGKISPTQSLKGMDEVTDVLDYPNCESAEELEAEGKERLKASASSDSVKMSFDADESTYDIGDIVGAREIITGIAVAKAITKKIVSINKGKVSIQYKVGE